MNAKQFHLQPDQIERLIDDTRMCLATDRIVVDGEPIGYLYRQESTEEADSGWRFMVGDESPEYMADATNIGVYALNTLANYERSVVELLDALPGAAFERAAEGAFVAVEALTAAREAVNTTHPDLHPEYPVVEGEYQLTQHWALTLPQPASRRFEDGSLVLWRPGLTVHIVAWDNTTGESIDERVAQLRASVPETSTGMAETTEPGLTRVSYNTPDGSMNAFVVAEAAQLLASFYFDDRDGMDQATAISASLRHVTPA